MSEPRHHWLTRIYPIAWRRRYGDEMDELLSHGFGWRDAFDVARAALVEWLFHRRRIGAETMRTYPGNIAILVRKPSAIAPIIMSLIALSVVLVAIAISGANQLRQATDEGTAAHLWQLLMVGQLPFLGWFALYWLRRDFRAGLLILGLQISAFVAALLPVLLLGL